MATRSPSGTSTRSATSSASSSERRNAPAKPSTIIARSRRPISEVVGQAAIMRAITSWVAGAFGLGAVPSEWRMPRSTARTASLAVGGVCPFIR
jgi:hypothetical protein